tara:strand:- start:790 stop:1149 length:360 start_codon:yes stop_codon:yes gene_type:complete
MGHKMKGMDFGTGQVHGAGNSPVKFWGAIGKAVVTGAKAVGKAAIKGGGKALKAAGKGIAKAGGVAVKDGKIGKAALKGAGKLAAKGIGKAAKHAATDSFAQHQEQKNKVPSNAPTVNF